MSAKSRFMARRTSVPGKILIWPVANKTSWRKQRVLPSVSLLRMSLDGKTFVDRTKNVTVFGANAMPSYTGYNWNTPAGENCDGCGRSYTSALNHRSLLYWEILDDGYTAEQWFHASPLSLQASKGPDNSVQDVEFYLREP